MFEALLRASRQNGSQTDIDTPIPGLACLAAELGDRETDHRAPRRPPALCCRSGPPWDDLNARHREDPVAVLLAEVGDVSTSDFEDPQAGQPEHGHQREVVRVR
jgi:hypothetical protein